jgi:hypothetical protein
MRSAHVSGRRNRGIKIVEPGFLKRLITLAVLAWLLRWAAVEAASHWARIRSKRDMSGA